MKKKLLSLTMALSMMTTMGATVFASDDVTTEPTNQLVSFDNEVSTIASSYFTGQTGKMNSLFGTQSGSFNISSGSVTGDAKISNVEISTTVSSGSDSFRLVVVDPDGKSVATTISKSGTINLKDFNGKYPKGTWQIYIITNGTVSTVTSARMTVDYTY